MASRLTAVSAALRMAVLCMALTGCATEVSRISTRFSPAAGTDSRFIVVTKEVVVTPSSGYSSTLKAGSTWEYVGRIPEGDVYRIQDDVFMLEGKHMHEAYCVIANKELVGFYMAVENAFSPLSPSVPLPVNQK